MTIPSGSNYPEAFDTDDNLFLVHDSLRVKLLEDYNPGDTSILIDGDNSKFPPTGFITLTEQCNEAQYRAISFYYGSLTATSFDQLELLPGFTDIVKPKRLTNVTMNVMSQHHNSLKDALIAIEEFIGKKGTEDKVPLGSTLVGRLNFLRRMVLSPRAWFSADKRIGIVPVKVKFTDESFRNPLYWKWDFGDGTGTPSNSISSTSLGPAQSLPIVTGAVPCGPIPVVDTTESVVTKTYYKPAKYDVTLTVANQFGEDEITIKEFFEARAPAPDEASIGISPTKTTINKLVNLNIITTGEQVDGNNNIIDPIESYTWKLNDDLPHTNSPDTTALYSIGGIYDVKLRVDTKLGAYRITAVNNAINIVEQQNLWLLAFTTTNSHLAISKTLQTYEFGLISESFKSNVMPTLSVSRDYTFIQNNWDNRDYQFSLFFRNTSFAHIGTVASGDGGTGILYWAEDSETIRFKLFQPFIEAWATSNLIVGETQTQNWNWLGLNSPDSLFIIFGEDTVSANPASVSQNKTQYSLASGAQSLSSYSGPDYLNGANELTTYPNSAPATYRSTFKDNNAYIARNDVGPGAFFRLRSFYRTEGTLADFTTSIRKITDIPGSARTELELVSLSTGIYVFNNSGEVSAYNTISGSWTTGGPGLGSVSFRQLQDSDVASFADTSQPLMAASDGDQRVYISYDYSPNAFIKFNASDLTFSSLGSRPTSNEQFYLTIF